MKSKRATVVARTEVVEVIRIDVRNRQPSELLGELIKIIERQRQGWQVIVIQVEVVRGTAEKTL